MKCGPFLRTYVANYFRAVIKCTTQYLIFFSSVSTILDPRFKEHGFVHRNNYTNAAMKLQDELKQTVKEKGLRTSGKSVSNDQQNVFISPTR